MNISRRASVTSEGIRCEFLQLKNQEKIIKNLVNGNTTNGKLSQGYCTLYQGPISFLAKDNFSLFYSPHAKELRQPWILDSTSWIPDARYWIPVFVSGTWILDSIVSGILDPLSGMPGSMTRDFGFQKENFPTVRNPDSLTLVL